jgi:5'-phosphate synthase pdxT subunit
MRKAGVLALQGDFAAHAEALRAVELDCREVRRTAELEGLDGLVVPGGESTTLLNLMADEPWFEALRRFHSRGGALLGTCAGAILLAHEVTDREQPTLDLIDVTIERNAYGRQVDSFEADLRMLDSEAPLRAAFIRAPRFRRLGEGVEVLAWLGDEPVLVRQGRVLAATFHTELSTDRRLHELFSKTVFDCDKNEERESQHTAGGAQFPVAVA